MTSTPPPIPLGTPIAQLQSDPSLWDRISTWVSENKAVVYTIAGVAVVVTGAGAVYYIRNNSVSKCDISGSAFSLEALRKVASRTGSSALKEALLMV